MRICYLGNFGVSFSTESHVAKSLEELGHAVTKAQENQVTAEQVAQMLPGHELLLWTRTGDWLKGDAWAMLRSAKALGIPSAAFHLDLYCGLQRSGDPEKAPWWKCDYVFTADGGSDAFWKRLGIRHIWSPPGVYGAECYIAPFEGWTHDVVFIGQRDYHIEHGWRPLLIDWLHSTYGSRFGHYGHSHETTVRGDKLNRLYRASRVAVGDSLVLGFTHENYWSDRVSECTGRGGFLIMPRIKGLEQFYEEGREMVFYEFGDLDGLRRLIDYYVEHDDERESIREAGHKATLRHSTYRHRMTSMINTIFGNESAV